MQKRAFLREVDIFAQLADPELDLLCGIARETALAKGDLVFKERDPGTSLYLVREGCVDLVRSDGKTRLARLERGQLFGELALFDDRPRTTAAVASIADRTVLFVMAKSDLDALFQAHPALGAKVLRGIVRRVALRLRAADDAIQTLVRSTLPAWT